MSGAGGGRPPVRVSTQWLDLREAADAGARAPELVEALLAAWRDRPPGSPLVVHDLGCGSGAMVRWLAPRLPGAQHWVLHDLDPDLLDVAVARGAGVRAADGSPVTATARLDDVTRLDGADLEGAALVTGSALLDLLSAQELDRLVAACVAAGCPALVALTVVGRVALAPADPLDGVVTTAFNDHQRRPVPGGPLLGPDAAAAAVAAFRAAGWAVRVAASDWQLDGRQAALGLAWLDGWVGAAAEVRPDLAATLHDYAVRRGAQARAGGLVVTVAHLDLLALPGPGALLR